MIQEELAMAKEFKRKEQETQQQANVDKVKKEEDKAKKVSEENETPDNERVDKEKITSVEGLVETDTSPSPVSVIGEYFFLCLLFTLVLGIIWRCFVDIGIGDKRRIVDAGDPFGSSAHDMGITVEMPFHKQFIHLAEGSKFEGDICADIAKTEEETFAVLEEMAVAEKGAPLTASEVQALGDMALQSAVCQLPFW